MEADYRDRRYYIYQLSDCPARFVNEGVYNDIDCTAPINAWAQAVPYCLIAFSEVFASITALEYAIGKVSLFPKLSLKHGIFAGPKH